MKRIHPLITLTAGLFVGLLCGAAITTAHSDLPKFDSEQIVAQAGETKLTRGQLAQYALAQVGSKMLEGQLRDAIIVAEGARRANISVTADDLKKRIDESLKYADDDTQRKQLEATPRWILEEKLRPVLTLEKLMKINISDNEAQDFYQSNTKLFIHPAKVHLICIATNSQVSAESALKQLKDNVDAGKISADLSIDEDLRTHKGDIGWFDRESMTPQVAQAIFEGNDGNPLKPGQFTGIVKETSQGGETYLLFYIADTRAGDSPSFEQVKDVAVYYCRAEKMAKSAPGWFVKNIRDIPWKCLKDFADPQSELVTVPLNERDYLPKPAAQPGAQPGVQPGNQQ